ncbi:hypothetical protein DIE17_00145 [Burkholderia sp. Bp9099]|nr:hypothetical protein DIE17_00145 [Burkholderia sp. Bp9099]
MFPRVESRSQPGGHAACSRVSRADVEVDANALNLNIESGWPARTGVRGLREPETRGLRPAQRGTRLTPPST